MAEKTRNSKVPAVVSVDEVFNRLKPGMSIFLSTGVAEPRTLVEGLISSENYNLSDLELIQVFSLGDIITHNTLNSNKYRLKTFFQGWVADEAIRAGRVDLIPGFFSQIPELIESGLVNIDVAFVQVTPPNSSGYCSLGVAMDCSRQAIQQADLVVGEINRQIPVTFGDTFVHQSELDYLVESTKPPIYFDRWQPDDTIRKLAANVASVIDDCSCLAFSVGPLFEALAEELKQKRNLGIHTPFFTDALMDLHECGVVTNRCKGIFKGKSLTSYALGTPVLMDWLDANPLVEFQSTEKVMNSLTIGQNPDFVAVIPCRKVDLSGRIAIHAGKSNVAITPGEIINFVTGSRLSKGGMSIFALPSRNLKKESNIHLSIAQYPYQFNSRGSVDVVITDYGVANLKGRTVRERAQAMIEVAHPDDRQRLVEEAKEANILFKDQIFLSASSALYPSEVNFKHRFKDNLAVRFRAIKPSDEEQMRRLFYRFSSESVYYRYFTHVKSMPHAKMQKYVNVDYRQTMSIVGLVGEVGHGKIIAEARYVKLDNTPYADIAFVVDEDYKNCGIASYLYRQLIRLAKERGLQGFVADVLTTNGSMMKVFERYGSVDAKLEPGEYHLTINFEKLTLPPL
ncbi:GNAT family N-acetyltransferase [bacterium]|nr:GNAT family N-acetyltransferase [bacterium]